MDEAEFDKFAAEYRSIHAANLKITGEQPEYFAEYKVIDVAAELGRARRKIASNPAILDFGAGVGYSIPFFERHLPAARVTCLDVSKKSLDIGAAHYAPRADFTHFDGSSIPYGDGRFDIAFASCVFHHIPHDLHLSLLTEIRRVLKPNGLLFIFEHNPLNPLTLRAVKACPFDENAHLIHARVMLERIVRAGFEGARIKYRIFFPRLLRSLRSLEARLTWLPLGAQYFVIARK